MEKGIDNIGREEFDSVWDRVTKGSAVQPLAEPPITKATQLPLENIAGLKGLANAPAPFAADRVQEAARLREIMSRIALSAREACQAAKVCGGRSAEVLRCIERSCRATNRDLNAQYYILTRECCCPGSSLAPTCCGREAIRDIAEREAETREMCLAAADTTQFPSLELAYTRAARECGCRERAAERLLAQTACN